MKIDDLLKLINIGVAYKIHALNLIESCMILGVITSNIII